MTKEIPLHQNESYWLLDSELCSVIECVLDPATLSLYPDYAPLRSALSAYAGVSPEQVALTPGSDAAISLIAEICVQKGYEILLPVPTFYGYERILARHNAKVIPTYYSHKDGQFEFPLESTLSEMRPNTALFLCHPNNPLGCSISTDDLTQLLDAAKAQGTLVVLDEAYYEFGGSTSKDRVTEQPLVVIRTLSKAFGLSGARIGYTISSNAQARELEALQLPWPIAHASADAACKLLREEQKVARRRKIVMEDRDTFIRELSDIPGIQAYASATNFVLIRSRAAVKIADMLLHEGIRVAQTDFMTGFPIAQKLLENTLRLSVPDPGDRKRVLSVLESMHLQANSSVV